MLKPKHILLDVVTPTVSRNFQRGNHLCHLRLLIPRYSRSRSPDGLDRSSGSAKHHHSWSISYSDPLNSFVRPSVRVRVYNSTPVAVQFISSRALLRASAVTKQRQFQQPQGKQLNQEDPLVITRIMEPSKNSPEAEGDFSNNENKQQQLATPSAIASSSAPNTNNGQPSSSQAKEEPTLSPLTPAEFKTYNRLAVQMDYFHEHFRSIWKTLYTACTNNKRPANLSLKQFIEEGLRLTQYLEAHHSIEENYLYPILAKKMPQFRVGGPKGKSKGKGGEDCDLLRQHQEIHRGMDVFTDYLKACKNRETELDLSVLKEKMDSWGDVLFQHLDDEVKELEAENMRKYWTLAEVKVIPM